MKMRDLIVGGTSRHDFFYSQFLSQHIKVRALSAWELEKSGIRALQGVQSEKLVKMLVDIALARTNDKDSIQVTADEYAELREHAHRSDVYTCFIGMRDFDDTITPEMLESSGLEVKDIASFIRKLSAAPNDSIYEFLRTKDGITLATIHYQLHVPLVSDAWKATRLQLDFLDLARNLRDIEEIDALPFRSEELTRENIGDVLKAVSNVSRQRNGSESGS